MFLVHRYINLCIPSVYASHIACSDIFSSPLADSSPLLNNAFGYANLSDIDFSSDPIFKLLFCSGVAADIVPCGGFCNFCISANLLDFIV
jgi:hypothetical protein